MCLVTCARGPRNSTIYVEKMSQRYPNGLLPWARPNGGTDSALSGDPSSLIRPPTLSNYRVPSINTGPNFTVRDTGSVTIDFDGIDLRPEQRLKLPPVRLLVESPEGSILDVEWKATAGNVPRRLTGSFRLTVGASTLSFDDIKVDRETDVNEDEDDD